VGNPHSVGGGGGAAKLMQGSLRNKKKKYGYLLPWQGVGEERTAGSSHGGADNKRLVMNGAILGEKESGEVLGGGNMCWWKPGKSRPG